MELGKISSQIYKITLNINGLNFSLEDRDCQVEFSAQENIRHNKAMH